MRKRVISREQLEKALEESKHIRDLVKILGRSQNTIKLYFKKYGMAIPKGLYSIEGAKERNIQKMKEEFKGEGNPFFGKSHSEKSREQMSKNHADFTGDKNPFKKACEANPNLRLELSNRVQTNWSELTPNQRYKRSSKPIVGDISKNHWTRCRNNAKTRKLVFDLTPEEAWELWNLQDGKCALTGIDLNLKSCYDITASLDRIDSHQGYTKDNVQWVHKDINAMKWSLSNERFIEFCRLVAVHSYEHSEKSNDSGNITETKLDPAA